jgi:predicted DNA-binding transcriptional regulator AlpA
LLKKLVLVLAARTAYPPAIGHQELEVCMEQNQENLKIPEVAKLLRISRNRAYNIAASDPTFPVIVIGRRLIVPRKDLQDWLEGQRRDYRP